MNLQQIRDVATVMMGGRAADMVLGAGPNAGAAGDIETATRVLLAAHEQQGLVDTLLYMPAFGSRPSSANLNAVAAEIQVCLQRAVALVEAEKEVVVVLAERLIGSRVMSGSKVAECLGHGPRPRCAVPAQPRSMTQ